MGDVKGDLRVYESMIYHETIFIHLFPLFILIIDVLCHCYII